MAGPVEVASSAPRRIASLSCLSMDGLDASTSYSRSKNLSHSSSTGNLSEQFLIPLSSSSLTSLILTDVSAPLPTHHEETQTNSYLYSTSAPLSVSQKLLASRLQQEGRRLRRKQQQQQQQPQESMVDQSPQYSSKLHDIAHDSQDELLTKLMVASRSLDSLQPKPKSSHFCAPDSTNDFITSNVDSSDDEVEYTTRLITAGLSIPQQRHHSFTSGQLSRPSLFSGLATSPPSAFDPNDADSGCGANDDRHSTGSASSLSSVERRSKGNYHLSSGQAAVELHMRLSRARQTLDFAKRQAGAFSALSRCRMGVWEALELLDELRDHEAILMGQASGVDREMTLMDHAIQTAELCRARWPDKDHLHLAGLIHGLGKLLAHDMWGPQPAWVVCGETFPVGCAFSSQISGSNFFSANPDKRRRSLNTAVGIYQLCCGLRKVYMSWSASEYLYLVLLLNNTKLPSEALFLIRLARCASITQPGSTAYRQLMTEEDLSLIPLLAEFQHMVMHRRAVPAACSDLSKEALRAYYTGLMEKYGLGPGPLRW